ncbi:uncharacterized protein LOC125813083 [Solanum verrucosum]|uniref:uncharacterized protein LOC125813083 n=1 Tax=Solanum verrucosum TaxID=315347 RepID=UPI0020D06BD4|nr:uncharacterized protein LOC125813083 [Solanum verrucosum]
MKRKNGKSTFGDLKVDMNTIRANARRMEEEIVNEGVPPQGPKGDQVPQGNQVLVDPPAMSNEEVRLRDFVRMNPPVFLGSKVGEDPQEFVDEMYKVLPREKREATVKDFINLRQGSMSVQEYSLKFTLLTMYAPSLVSNSRDEMSRYVKGVSNLVEEECHTTMLHDDMNISSFMVFAQQIEEFKIKKKNREMKRTRSDEQGQPRFKKRAFNQDSSSTSRVNQEKGNGSPFPKSTCTTCGKKHYGKCLAYTNGCYGCGKSDHQVRNCPTLTAKGREVKQASLDGTVPIPLNYGCFYALPSKEDK